MIFFIVFTSDTNTTFTPTNIIFTLVTKSFTSEFSSILGTSESHKEIYTHTHTPQEQPAIQNVDCAILDRYFDT